MPFVEAIWLALAQIRVQKLKSFFTLLGVCIGVMFLIAETIWRLMPYLIPSNATDETFANTYRFAQASADYPWLIFKYLIAAFAEELVTRGYLITRLNDLFRSRGKAVLFAAILFSSIHLYQGFAGMVDTFVFGLAYGIAFLVCGRIWPLALGHALSNMRIELVGW